MNYVLINEKLHEGRMTDLLCPSKNIRLKASSKPWIDSETIPDKLFPKM